MCITSQIRIIYNPHARADIYNPLQNTPLPEHLLVNFFGRKLWVMTYFKAMDKRFEVKEINKILPTTKLMKVRIRQNLKIEP